MKTIEALAQEVRNADNENKALSWGLCRELAEAAGEADRYDAIKLEDDDSVDGREWKLGKRYAIAEAACRKLHIARHGAAMVWCDGCDPYWDYEDEIIDNEDGIWDRIAAAIGADADLADMDRIKAIIAFCKTSLFDVHVEV